MRKAVAGLLVLLVLAVIGDRVAVGIADRKVAAQLQASQSLAVAPDVRVAGFPFLTQAVAGRYGRITVVAHDLPVRGQVRIATLTAELTDAQVPLGDALAGRVTRVPVSGITATALLRYSDLAASSGSRALQLSPSGDALRVTGALTALGQTVTASVLAKVSLDGDLVRLTGSDVTVGGRQPPAALAAVLRGRLDYSVRVGRLPFGLHLTSVQVRPDGVAVSAQAGPTVLVAG